GPDLSDAAPSLAAPTPLPLPFRRPQSRAVADVVNDHFVRSDLVHDQIVADGQSSETTVACCLSDVRGGSNSPRRIFNASNKPTCRCPTVRSYVRKNFIKIGKCAAFISELHALR